MAKQSRTLNQRKMGPLHVYYGERKPVIMDTDKGREVARITLSGHIVGKEAGYSEYAQLFAAAPELLEALRAMLKVAGTEGNNAAKAVAGTKARAAIAKAEAH